MSFIKSPPSRLHAECSIMIIEPSLQLEWFPSILRHQVHSSLIGDSDEKPRDACIKHIYSCSHLSYLTWHFSISCIFFTLYLLIWYCTVHTSQTIWLLHNHTVLLLNTHPVVVNTSPFSHHSLTLFQYTMEYSPSYHVAAARSLQFTTYMYGTYFWAPYFLP